MGAPLTMMFGERELSWNMFGFVLPDGLADAPAGLVTAQQELIVELIAAKEHDWNFELPVELLWDRMLPWFREPDVAAVIERALLRMYHGRAEAAVHVQPLNDYRLVPRGESFDVVSPSLRPAQLHAHIGAAVLAARGVSERCLDLAQEVARVYLGDPLRNKANVLPMSESCAVIRRLAMPAVAAECAQRLGADSSIAVTAISAAADQLTEDEFPVLSEMYGGGPVSEDEAARLRHMWGHGRDREFELVSRAAVTSLCHAVSDQFGRMMWLLMGTSSGSACQEWFDARTGKRPPIA